MTKLSADSKVTNGARIVPVRILLATGMADIFDDLSTISLEIWQSDSAPVSGLAVDEPDVSFRPRCAYHAVQHKSDLS